MKDRYGIISLKLPDGTVTDVLVAEGVINEIAVDVKIVEKQIKAGEIKDTGLFSLVIPVLKIAPAEKGKPWKTLPEQYENEIKV